LYRLVCAGALCALALGTAARAAAVVDISPLAVSTTQLGDHSSVAHPAGSDDLTDGYRGLNYTSTYSTVGPQTSEISFESGGISVGDQTRTTSVFRIDMTIDNTDASPLVSTLKSQITAAGFGVYLGDNAAGNCFTAPDNCGQTYGAHTLSDLGQVGTSGPIAGVTFDVTVLQDANIDSPLLHLTGGLSIDQNGGLVQDVSQLSSGLDGFVALDQFGHPNSALGFAWDATDFTRQLNPIIAFGSSTISYIVTVSTFNNARCFADATCLVAYAGYGDPIGRGGDISPFALPFNSDGLDYIGGVNFSPETLDVPRFDSAGDLIFAAPGAVPEPATWVSLIAGFGLMGACLRRRHSAAA
jgi:hypothetical protein